jgi:membrane fusion protein (multidrug efflux system)
MIKRMILMLLLVGLVLGGAYAFQVLKTKLIAKALADYAATPKTVSTTTVGYQPWQPSLTAVGTIKAAQGVTVAPEIPGIIDSIDFDSGEMVAAGAPLVQLRLDDAGSRLAQFQAAAQLAQVTYQRDRRQLADKAISQATVDSDLANLKSAVAQVQAQQALIDEKTIRAPFAGRLGIRQVDTGQYVNPGTAIVSLQNLGTLYVDFYLPQQALATVDGGQPVTVTVDAFPGKTFAGRIAAIDSSVDLGTRNVLLRARLDPTTLALLPGMFATLSVIDQPQKQQLTLPQTAITFNAYGDTVFLVVPKGHDDKGNPILTAQQAFVKTGTTRGDQISILSGISPGETVVTAGQSKLSNGTVVVIDNSVQPSDSPDPLLTPQ